MIIIKLCSLGRLPNNCDLRGLIRWKSELFKFCEQIDHYEITVGADGENWGYTDRRLEDILPHSNGESSFTFIVTDVPLECNYFARRLSNNRVIFTLFETNDILSEMEIPLQNALLCAIYRYSLIFMGLGIIPTYEESSLGSHDAVRGCIYDMAGRKKQIAVACQSAIICEECIVRLRQYRIPENILLSSKKELALIKVPFLARIKNSIKKNPFKHLFVSSVIGFLLGILASYIAGMITK